VANPGTNTTGAINRQNPPVRRQVVRRAAGRRLGADLISAAGRARAYARGYRIPDPQEWPADVEQWLAEIKGRSDRWDVTIFDHRTHAALYLHDAIVALAILDDPTEWNVEFGYPIFRFDPDRIDEYIGQLALFGYKVRVFDPVAGSKEAGAQLPGTKIVDIAAARKRLRSETAKGATL